MSFQVNAERTMLPAAVFVEDEWRGGSSELLLLHIKIAIYIHTHVYATHQDYLVLPIYVHMFRTDHLGLEKLYGNSSLEETDPPSLSSHGSAVHMEFC